MSEDPQQRHPLNDAPQRHPLSDTEPQSDHEWNSSPQPQRPQPVRLNIAQAKNASLTTLLVGINVAIFAVGFLLPALDEQIFLFGMNYPPMVIENLQVYRLLTAMFLHASAAHIFFNAYALYVIGSNLERIYGPTRFAIIYFLGGLTGSLLSVALGSYDVPSVGASGAVFAIFAAEALHVYLHRASYGSAAQGFLMNRAILLGINLLLGFMPGSRIDNWGHIGGLIGGAILAYLAGPRLSAKRTFDTDSLVVRVEVTNAYPLVKRLPFVWLYAASLIVLLLFTVIIRSP